MRLLFLKKIIKILHFNALVGNSMSESKSDTLGKVKAENLFTFPLYGRKFQKDLEFLIEVLPATPH